MVNGLSLGREESLSEHRANQAGHCRPSAS